MAGGIEPIVLDPPLIVPLTGDSDVVLARHAVREQAVALGLDLVTQTKLITAASELGRNTVVYGLGGTMTISVLQQAGTGRSGLQLVFADDGPGIADLAMAMTGGWSSGNGLGLGLPGSKRLVHEFDVRSEPGQGTVVTVVVWKRG